MGKIKGWKKLKTTRFDNYRNEYNKSIFLQITKVPSGILKHGLKWKVWVGSLNKTHLFKLFKTKAQTIKFATKWMRANSRGEMRWVG